MSNLWYFVIVCCSVTQLCPTLCDPVGCSTPVFPVLQYLPKFAQTHVHWADDAIQPSHPLSPTSPVLSLFQHQDLFQWVSSLHQVTKVLQLQPQYFQWIFRVDFFNNRIYTTEVVLKKTEGEHAEKMFCPVPALFWIFSISYPSFIFYLQFY